MYHNTKNEPSHDKSVSAVVLGVGESFFPTISLYFRPRPESRPHVLSVKFRSAKSVVQEGISCSNVNGPVGWINNKSRSRIKHKTSQSHHRFGVRLSAQLSYHTDHTDHSAAIILIALIIMIRGKSPSYVGTEVVMLDFCIPLIVLTHCLELNTYLNYCFITVCLNTPLQPSRPT